jgi:hypothetical protein
MRVPPEVYQMRAVLSERFPELRPAQHMGLALWVFGAVLAHSACQSAVLAALVAAGVARCDVGAASWRWRSTPQRMGRG